jgi:hypothetical protein
LSWLDKLTQCSGIHLKKVGRLCLPDRDIQRSEPSAVIAHEGNQVASAVDNANIHLLISTAFFFAAAMTASACAMKEQKVKANYFFIFPD